MMRRCNEGQRDLSLAAECASLFSLHSAPADLLQRKSSCDRRAFTTASGVSAERSSGQCRAATACGRSPRSSRTNRRRFATFIQGQPMPSKQAAAKTLEIKVAHSPDSDDAFMFYALATNRVKAPGLKFTHVLSDIETLNRAADRRSLRRHGDQFCGLRLFARKIRAAGLRRELWRRLRTDRRGDQAYAARGFARACASACRACAPRHI